MGWRFSAGGLAVSTVIDSVGIGTSGGIGLFGGTASGTVINSGGQEGVFSGGLDAGATVSTGGVLFINSRGFGRFRRAQGDRNLR